jgi:hypothetical protein
MKYLKTFEKNLLEDIVKYQNNMLDNESFFIVQYVEEGIITPYLLPDRESAENWTVHLINKDRRQMLGHNYNNKMVFTDFSEAMFWYEKNVDIKIQIQEVKLKKPFEGDQDMIKMRELKKNSRL